MDWFPLWLSLRVAATATVIAAAVGVSGGYLLAKGRFPGRGLLEAVASVPIVLPPTVLGYYLLVVCGQNTVIGDTWRRVTGQPLVFTPAGAVLAAALVSLPFSLRTARAAIGSVDPRQEQAARTLGLPEWQIAARITLPMARRGILAGIALGFARALGDFGTTVMVAGDIPDHTQTMPLAVYDAVQAGNNHQAGLLAVLLSVVAVTVLLLVNRFSGNAL